MKTSVLQSCLIAVFFGFQLSIHAQNIQGPYPPTFITEQYAGCLSCPGSNWNNPMNADDPDSLYATAMLNPHSQCVFGLCFARGLIATGFNFNIPVTAVMKGVKAEVLRKASFPNCIVDTVVQLWNSGPIAVGTNHAANGYWDVTALYADYGDSTDMWGTTLTSTDINSSGFGVFFQPINLNPNYCDASVDHGRLTVYYETAIGLTEQTSENNFWVYYNSSAQSIHIKIADVPDRNNFICMYNSEGQKVSENNFDFKAVQQISTQNLSRGIYFLVIHLGDKTFAKKIAIPF